MNDISSLNDVCLPLLPKLPCGFDWTHRFITITKIMEVLICHDFGFDEAALKITVNDACRLRGQCTLLNDPAATFFFTSLTTVNLRVS
jgi:hypothetical protein